MLRHRLRRTTWLTLLAWVLTSLAGLVNACQLQPHDARVPKFAAAQQLDPTAPDGHTHAAARGAHQTAPGACLAHLADAAATVAKSEPAQTAGAGAAVQPGLAWRPAPPAATVALWRSWARPAPPGAALVIRLLRLTI